jgi:hypothetical protein
MAWDTVLILGIVISLNRLSNRLSKGNARQGIGQFGTIVVNNPFFCGFPMASASARSLLLLPVLLTSCAGNTGMQDAFKADSRLTPSALPSSAPISSPTASPPAAAPNQTPASPTPTPMQSSPSTWVDLDQTPPQIRSYLNDLIALDLIQPTLKPAAKLTLGDPIDRRTAAKWLLAVNNRFYETTPARLIRPAPPNTRPTFQDIPNTDPDFATIQGLAEAGIIPSSLSNNAGGERFYPDKPIIREDLLRWKVPLDARTALPAATIANIRQVWGFQDADKINPVALAALYHDHQNGDAANLRRALGYTTLLQPKRAVTHAEAAAMLWSIGFQTDRITAQDLLKK